MVNNEKDLRKDSRHTWRVQACSSCPLVVEADACRRVPNQMHHVHPHPVPDMQTSHSQWHQWKGKHKYGSPLQWALWNGRWRREMSDWMLQGWAKIQWERGQGGGAGGGNEIGESSYHNTSFHALIILHTLSTLFIKPTLLSHRMLILPKFHILLPHLISQSQFRFT